MKGVNARQHLQRFTHLSLSLYIQILVFYLSWLLRPATQQVLDNVGELPTSTGAKDIDLLFLRGIMESPNVRSLDKVAHTQKHTHTER